MKVQVNRKSIFLLLIVSMIMVVVIIFGGIFIMKNNTNQNNDKDKEQEIITAKAENYDELVAGARLVTFIAVGVDRTGKPPIIINISKAGQENGEVFVILEPISIGNFGGVFKQTKLFLGQTIPIYNFYKNIYNDLRNNECDTEKAYQTGTVSLVSLEEVEEVGGQQVTLALKLDDLPPIVTAKAENYDELVAGGRVTYFDSVGGVIAPDYKHTVSKASQENGRAFIILEPDDIEGFGGVLQQTKVFLGEPVPVYHFYKGIDDDLRNNNVDIEKAYQTGTVTLVDLKSTSHGGQYVEVVLKKDE